MVFTLGERESNPKRVANNLRFVLGIARYPSGTAKSTARAMNKIIERTVVSRKQNGVS